MILSYPKTILEPEGLASDGLARSGGHSYDEREPTSMAFKKKSKRDSKGRKICFFGNFGTGNFGNEITFQTVLYHFRQRFPDAEFACICTNPKKTAASQQIESIPMERDFSGPGKRVSLLARLLRQIFVRLPRELFRWFEAFRTLRRADMLIVPGTGLLTDAYGVRGPGPYNAFKWTLMGRLCRCKILFVGVGAGPIYTVPGRFFVKSALSLADFRSYRDVATMNCLKAIGVQTNSDRICPDLVFSLSDAMMPLDQSHERRRRVVGLGLMSYAGKYSVAEPNDAVYREYLQNLVVFTGWLLEHDYDIRLLVGEADDWTVLEEFKALLKTTAGGYDPERIIDEPARCVEELLPQIAATDLVVATRFHNIVLALVLNKPTIAISFHHKCASIMTQMSLEDYSHDINHINAGRLIEQFTDMEKKAKEVKSLLLEKVEQSRKALDEQYNLIFELAAE